MPQNTQSGHDGRDDRETNANASRTEQPRNEQPRDEGRSHGTGLTGWVTETAFRAGIAIIGVVLLLFALGQAVGADFLGMFAAALSSQVGRWLAVAVFALFVIAAAFRVRIRGRTHH